MAARAASFLSTVPLIAVFALAPVVGIVAPRAHGSVPLILTVLALAGHLWRDRRVPPIAWGGVAVVAAFLGFAGLTALWTADPGFAAARVAKLAYLSAAGFVLIALVQAASERHRSAMRAVLLAGVVVGTAALALEMATDHRLYRLATGTPPTQSVPDFTVNRAALTLALLAVPAMLAANGRYGRAWGLGLIAAVAATVVLTASQSAPLALAAAVAAWAAARRGSRVTILALCGLAILALALAPWVALAAAGLDLSALPGWQQASGTARLEIWATVAALAVERPWFGHGLEALRFIVFDEPVGEAAAYTRVAHPHNGALQIWLEMGAFGVALAMTLICVLARGLLALGEESRRTAAAAVAAVLVTLLVSHGLWQSWWIGLLGVVAAAVGLTPRASIDARPVSAAVVPAAPPRRAAA